MKKQPSHNRHMISKNSILVLVMLVCIFLSTWAWFASAEEATATGLTISTKTPTTLELALPNEDGSYPKDDASYKSTLKFNTVESINRIMEADVTSDGLNFIIPTTTQGDGVRTVKADGVWKRATAKVDYVSIPFYIRSQDPDIFISKYSQVDATLTSNGNVVNQSDVTGISRNAIVGAMRVSIVDMTRSINESTYKPRSSNIKLLWIPRPDLYLDTPQTSNWKLLTNIQNTSPLPEGVEVGETYRHKYCKIQKSSEENNNEGEGVNVNVTADDAVASQYRGNGITPILGVDKSIGNGKYYNDSGQPHDMEKVSDMENGTKYYVYKFVMNIWIEGSDAEARRILNQGEFNIDISFTTKT